ncbi:hypothetical protein BDV10DRAFT_187952 [Aspergillus recurvatus]
MAGRSLLHLPNELLLNIFYHMSSIGDVYSLAASCSRLHQLFTGNWRNRINVLRSAANIPWDRDYALGDAFSVLIRKPPSSWWVGTGSSTSYMLLDIDYSRIDAEMAERGMRDLAMIYRSRSQSSTFQSALHTFLMQFSEIEERWAQTWQPITDDILSSAAEYQIDLLEMSDQTVTEDTGLTGDTTILALALHCLIVVRDFIPIDFGDSWHAAGHELLDEEEEEEEEGFLRLYTRLNENDRTILPSVRIRQADDGEIPPLPTPDQFGFPGDASVEDMISHITQVSFRLLHTNDPRHWPTVLYVILILPLIRTSLSPFSWDWMENIPHTAKALEALYRDLARLFYVCTEGGFVLSTHWNEEKYEAAVGDCTPALDHAMNLCYLWMQRPDQDDRIKPGEHQGIDGFPKKVEYFAHDFY